LTTNHDISGQCKASAQRQHRAPRPLLFGTSPVGSLATRTPRISHNSFTFFTRLFRSLLLCFCTVLPLYGSGINSIFVPHCSFYRYTDNRPKYEPTGRDFPSSTPGVLLPLSRRVLRHTKDFEVPVNLNGRGTESLGLPHPAIRAHATPVPFPQS
jgi:hypothetical protein